LGHLTVNQSTVNCGLAPLPCLYDHLVLPVTTSVRFPSFVCLFFGHGLVFIIVPKLTFPESVIPED